MITIKALSMWQPWASLFVSGHKEYETRSWITRHEGWLAIHAAKSTKGRELAGDPLITQLINQLGFAGFDDMPRGCILGFVYITRILRITRYTRLGGIVNPSPLEKKLGDWSQGRYAWHASTLNRITLQEPIPAIGHQSLWNWQMSDGIELLKGKL